MQRNVPAIASLILIAMLFVGCQSTPRENYATVQDAYIASVETLLEYRADGFISQEDWEADILPLINEGDVVLDLIDAATRADVDATTYYERLSNVLTHLRPFLVELSRE